MSEVPAERDLQDSGSAHRNGGADLVRQRLGVNWRKWQDSLDGYILRHFAFGNEARDEVVGSAIEIALAKADEIWERFGGGEADLAGLDRYLFFYLRVVARYRALKASPREQRKGFYRDEGGEDDEGVYELPTTFVRPEQEDALFWKQMIERCERLPEHERALAGLIFDRATAYEMAKELGVPIREVLAETVALARKLDKENNRP